MTADIRQTAADPTRRARRFAALTLLCFTALAVGSCDFLDPTDVENPRTTDEDLLRADAPVAALLPGLEAQFARTIGSAAVVAEVVSDNYSIHGTGLNQELDEPRNVIPELTNSTGSTTGIYWNPQELRSLADFLIDDLAPDDENATDEQLARAHYYRGMAYLVQGENFTHVPVGREGPVLTAPELLDRAVADLEASLSLDGGGAFALPARAGLARAHRMRGDGGAAEAAATAVLDAEPDFLFVQGYDATTLENPPWFFLVQRALKEMQPLPRLDFLDPKYLERTSAIPVAKAEEMHLILAEAALADGRTTEGRDHLVAAIETALDRGTTTFVDDDERRNADLSVRPRDPDIVVRADPASPPRAGLILDRPGAEIEVPTVSGTSLDPDSVAGLSAEDEIWHALHLARQEILIAEGRRMSDLGIRLPMMLREIDAQPGIQIGDPGTQPVVPEYIPPGNRMDLFEPASPYADDEGTERVADEITILVDMNRVLTENGVSPFLSN